MKNWIGSDQDMDWYRIYSCRPITVRGNAKLDRKSWIRVIGATKCGKSGAIFHTKPGDVLVEDAMNPQTMVNKKLDRIPVLDFRCGEMPITCRQAFNLCMAGKPGSAPIFHA